MKKQERIRFEEKAREPIGYDIRREHERLELERKRFKEKKS